MSQLPALQVVEMAEWQTTTVKGSLSANDRRLMKSKPGRGIAVDELRDGMLRISAASSVGVVRLESLEIRILPKLAGDNLRLIEMIERTTGIDALKRLPSLQTISAKGASLFDLLALMLVDESERLVRNGLLYDYVTQEDAIPAVRGRLLADRQVLQRSGCLDRIICRFDEPQQDVLENRLIAAALSYCAKRVEHGMVRRRVRQVLTDYLACCEPLLDLSSAKHEITYNRMNEHYRDAHKLAWLVLDGLGVDDLLKAGGARCFSFLIDMNTLFERFIYLVVDRLLGQFGFHSRYQAADRSIIVNDLSQSPYARVIPDIIVRQNDRSGARLAIDAKYKLYDTKRVGSSDIYQAFIYAYAYGGNPGQSPQTLLIYPATQTGSQLDRLRVCTAGGLADATVTVLGLHIPSVLDEMRKGHCGLALEPLRSTVKQAFSIVPAVGEL
jgi:5-methylcytosine-specific restriction enzyme subunit McrC